jgi:hypothetical protein
MTNSKPSVRRLYERYLPYFPWFCMVLAYLALWAAQVIILDYRYLLLALITLPLAAALALAGIRIRRGQVSGGLEKDVDTENLVGQFNEPGAGLSRIMLAVLGLLIVFFTLVHHFFPQVFNVPENRGVPFSGLPEMLFIDIGTTSLGVLCFAHSLRIYGLYRSTMFLIGSFVFTGLQESIWIILGRFEVVGPSYYFTKAVFWFFETPALFTCLGWYYLAYSTTSIAGNLLPGRSILPRAFLAGLLALNYDLCGDPIATHPANMNWIWLSQEHLRVFSIPFTNFVAWFLLIFVFALLFERIPGLVRKHGTGKSALIFFAWLLVADVLILAFLAGLRWLISFMPYTNLTWWGI